MLNKDRLCLPSACVSSLPLGKAGPGLPTLCRCLFSRQSGGDFCPVAPPQPAEHLHEVQLCLSQERMGQHRGPSPPGGQRCSGGSRGDPEGPAPGQPTQPCLLPGTPATGGCGRGSGLLGAGEVGSPGLGAERRAPLTLLLAGAGWTPASKQLSGAEAAGSDPVAHSHSLFYPNTAPRAGRASTSPPAKGSRGRGQGGWVYSPGRALGLVQAACGTVLGQGDTGNAGTALP